MHIHVLGSAAGGGYPQWNCNHENSRQARRGDPFSLQRTQSSIAVTSDEERWFLFNASPDLRNQILETPALHPKYGLRQSPIQGAVLTNADVDHIAGLLTLRESQPLHIYATENVLQALARNGIFDVLNADFVKRIPLVLNQPNPLMGPDDSDARIVVIPFSVPGKVALWLEKENGEIQIANVNEDTIGLQICEADGTTKAYYIPGCASIPEWLAVRLEGSPLVLFDGTLWVDDELIRFGISTKTGKRMGHISVSGDDGTMAAFSSLNVKRKIFIHINTTNPILRTNSHERKEVEKAGWEVAYDGQEIRL